MSNIATRESEQLVAERRKLEAEEDEYDRDRWILPATAIVCVLGIVVAAIIALLPEILRAFGRA